MYECIKKKIPKVITIAGPVAISNWIELKSPNRTDTTETMIELKMILKKLY